MTAILNHRHVVPVFSLAPIKRAVAGVVAAFNRWSAARKSARLDAEYWALARTDHRVMADLHCAMCSQDKDKR